MGEIEKLRDMMIDPQLTAGISPRLVEAVGLPLQRPRLFYTTHGFWDRIADIQIRPVGTMDHIGPQNQAPLTQQPITERQGEQ